MLVVTIPEIEMYDPSKEEFITIPSTTISMEHSLVSVSKWESKWHKRFLDQRVEKTNEELVDYLRCMTLTKNVNPEIYDYFPAKVVEQINAYIEDPMTATTFAKKKSGPPQAISSELIYYWMIAFNIPFECQKWHLNRLLTLIQVCEEKNNPKKMSKSDILRQNRDLNAIRRKALNSRG